MSSIIVASETYNRPLRSSACARARVPCLPIFFSRGVECALFFFVTTGPPKKMLWTPAVESKTKTYNPRYTYRSTSRSISLSKRKPNAATSHARKWGFRLKGERERESKNMFSLFTCPCSYTDSRPYTRGESGETVFSRTQVPHKTPLGKSRAAHMNHLQKSSISATYTAVQMREVSP